MKNHRSTILLILILLIGLSLMLYPSFADWWNSFHSSRAIASYEEQVANIDDAQYEELWDAARDYNQSLLHRPNDLLLSDEQQEIYKSLLDIGGNGIMGYIEIPMIDVMLPIYHGTKESVLQIAVGHLDWTSLPVGGAGSHCVLSGHRGLPSARLFTDLDKLKVGDVFMLHVLNEILTYEIDQILIVEPQDTDPLLIEPGKDLCTMITCTPYGINSHRMLVRGHRIESQEEPKDIRITADAVRIEPLMVAPIVAVPILLVLLIILLLPKQKKGKLQVPPMKNGEKVYGRI